MLAWRQPDHGALKLTWSFANASVETDGTTNCTHMQRPDLTGFNPAELHHQAAGAFAYWQKIAAVDFEYVDDPAKALILIGALQDPQGIAFADVLHTPLPDMVRGEIQRGLICLNGSARWKTGFDGDLKSYDIRFVLAHEIGHVLGLDHPSATGQLMSWRYDERTREPQDGDRNGINMLYGLRPRMDAEVRAR